MSRQTGRTHCCFFLFSVHVENLEECKRLLQLVMRKKWDMLNLKDCKPECVRGVGSTSTSMASTSDARKSSGISSVSKDRDPEYYQFLDNEMSIGEVTTNRGDLQSIRHFTRLARLSLDEVMVANGRDFHMVEQLYYDSYTKYMPAVWKNYESDLFQVLKKEYARGTTGKIELVVHKRSRYLGILKAMPIAKITEARNEFNILNQCRECPFVINVIDGFENTKLHLREYSHYILLEFAPFLTLDHLTHAMKGLGSNDARLFCMEITLALEFLHSKNILHRDVKPENIFVLISGHVVLGDLGSAVVLDSSTLTLGRCATYVTRAPEIWNKEPYGKAADIWSLGITFYYIISNNWPFVSPYQHIQIEKVNGGKITFGPKFSPDATSIVSKMLLVDPKSRATCKDLLKHSFFDALQPPYDPPYPPAHFLHLYEKGVEMEIVRELLMQESKEEPVASL